MGPSEIELPGWVEEANRRLGRSRGPAVVDDWPTPPEVGDVRVAETTADGIARSRLACVLGVDRRVGAARVVLISNETEMASEEDVVVPGSGGGLPYDLLVVARVTGWVWWIQLGRRVGRLNPRWTTAVRRAVDGSSTPAARAAEIHGEWPRAALLEFQQSEAAELRRIAADCDASVAMGARGVPVVVDPKLLARRRDEPALRRERRLLQAAGELVGSRTAVVPREGLGEVLSVCEASRSVGPDLAVSLRPLLEGALMGLAVGPDQQRVDLEPRRVWNRREFGGSLAATLASLAAAHHGSVRLVTDQHEWPEDPTKNPHPLAIRCGERGRMQVVRHFLEVHPS